MKILLKRSLLFLFLSSVIISCSDEQLKVSDFCASLTPMQRILEDPDWTNWDMAPIYDELGKIHLFVGRWPKDGDWLVDAQIVHMVSDQPEGPYILMDTVFQNDTITYYNPQISRLNDLYIMVYSYKEMSIPRMNQKIGIASSHSLNGPWEMSPLNPVLGPSGIPGSANYLHASNPTFLKDKEGRYRIYYKSISDKPNNPYLRTISLAISDNVNGPYIDHPANPLISYVKYGLDVEDPYNFIYKDRYYMILEDRMGVANTYAGLPINLENIEPGGWRPGLIYESEDGIAWDVPEIGYQTNAYYFNEDLKRLERPHILWKDGKPEYLFLALDDGKYGLGTGAVLQIKGW